MKIGVITDIHANLPATMAAFNEMDRLGCDEVIHTGDAIGIGPHPREVIEFLFARTNLTLLSGNHDELFAFRQLDTPPAWMSAEELEHQKWTHSRLEDSWREMMAAWPRMCKRQVGNTAISFQHYAVNDGDFCSVSYTNKPAELDAIFRPATDIVFYGHHHPRADVRGRARYINPGALGCHPAKGARFVTIQPHDSKDIELEFHSVPYDSRAVFDDLVRLEVPARETIARIFLSH